MLLYRSPESRGCTIVSVLIVKKQAFYHLRTWEPSLYIDDVSGPRVQTYTPYLSENLLSLGGAVAHEIQA